MILKREGKYSDLINVCARGCVAGVVGRMARWLPTWDRFPVHVGFYLL